MIQEASEITLDYLSKRENRIAYIKARKLAAHEKAVIEQAVDEAVEEVKRQAEEEKKLAIDEVRKQAIDEARKQAIDEARKQIIDETRKKIVINLNNLKMPINKIVEVTNLTQQEVEAFLA